MYSNVRTLLTWRAKMQATPLTRKIGVDVLILVIISIKGFADHVDTATQAGFADHVDTATQAGKNADILWAFLPNLVALALTTWFIHKQYPDNGKCIITNIYCIAIIMWLLGEYNQIFASDVTSYSKITILTVGIFVSKVFLDITTACGAKFT